MCRKLNVFCLVLAVAATFFLYQMPCLADSALSNDAVQAPKEGVLESAAEIVEGARKVADAVVVKPAAEVAEGTRNVADKVVVKPVAGAAKGTLRLVKKTGTFVFKVVTFGLKSE